MTESQRTQQFLKKFRAAYPSAVAIKHAQMLGKGVLDVSITDWGRTVWIEAKRFEKGRLSPITPHQHTALWRLWHASRGRACVLAFTPLGGVTLWIPTSSVTVHRVIRRKDLRMDDAIAWIHELLTTDDTYRAWDIQQQLDTEDAQ